jgi:hypothetical protein
MKYHLTCISTMKFDCGSKKLFLLRTIALLLVLTACNQNNQVESKQNTPQQKTLASVQVGSNVISVVSINSWQDNCELNLLADGVQGKYEISLKENNAYCSMFGPVKLISAKRADQKKNIVIVQAARGGDGDHTGPILDVYSLSNNKFKKLGEQELFESGYKVRNDEILFITGKVLFSFCDVCDGPEAAGDEDNIFVPAKITFGCSGICVRPDISISERTALITRFNATKNQKLSEEGQDKDYFDFVNNLEKRFTEFLHQK